MTYEEAINHLVCGKIRCLIDDTKDEKLRNLCIKALEKQVAKKAVKSNTEKPCLCCPACGRCLWTENHHCKCGQKIDWSNEE